MFALQLRMWLLTAVLFAIIYAVVVAVGTYLGLYDFYFYLFISLGFMLIQYLMGPKIVEWTMQIRYVKKEEYPQLYRMVEDLARRGQIPMPKICVSQINIPNAFAFGRGKSDGRVCVTRAIMDLLNEEELKAVLGHELSHIKNRDVLTITLLSVIPMIMYRLAWNFLFFDRRRSDRGNNALFFLFAPPFFFFFF